VIKTTIDASANLKKALKKGEVSIDLETRPGGGCLLGGSEMKGGFQVMQPRQGWALAVKVGGGGPLV